MKRLTGILSGAALAATLLASPAAAEDGVTTLADTAWASSAFVAASAPGEQLPTREMVLNTIAGGQDNEQYVIAVPGATGTVLAGTEVTTLGDGRSSMTASVGAVVPASGVVLRGNLGGGCIDGLQVNSGPGDSLEFSGYSPAGATLQTKIKEERTPQGMVVTVSFQRVAQ